MIKYDNYESRRAAYQDGYQAFKAGRGRAWCPYGKADLAEAWRSGW